MSKIIFYRSKCIGCSICYEQQPERWRMSKKDGKAILLDGIEKKEIFILTVGESTQHKTKELTLACPVKIIKLV